MLDYLKGKKTYLVAIAAFIVGGAQAAGLITAETANTILTILGPLGLMSIRSAINGK